MFQFTGLAPNLRQVTGLQPAGLPHSDICGSILVCKSSQLFAAYHVLHRLQEPRHPPYALIHFLKCLIHPFAVYQTSLLFLKYVNELRSKDRCQYCGFAPLPPSGYCKSLSVSSITFDLQKGGVPAAPSGTATLLRLSPSYRFCPRTLLLRSRTSGTPNFHGLTGGVYKARERIHRAMADARLLANPTSWRRVSASNPN